MEDGFASAIINLVPKLEPRDEDNDITGEFVESILPTVEPTSNENKSDPLATKIKVENPYLLKEFKVLLRDCLKNVTTLKSDVKDEPEDNVEEYTENVDHFSDSQGTEYPSDNESSMPQENVTKNWQMNFKTESVPSSSKQKTSTAWIYKLNKAGIQEQLRNFGLPEVNYLQDGRRILKAFLRREYDPAGKTRTSTETLTNNPPRTENESTMTSQSNVIPEQENNVSANKRKRKKLSYHQGDSSVSESDNDESYNPQEALQEFLPTKKTRTSTVREKTLNKGKLLSAKTKTVKEMLSSLPSETGIAVEPAQIGSLLPKKPSKKKKRTNETELSCFLSSETGIAVETAQIDPSLAEKPSAEKKTNGTQMDVVLWYCPSCELQFKQFIEFYRHHIDKHSAEELKCLKCPDQLFASPDQIEKHNLDAHLVSSKKSYHCEECRLVFGLKSSYFLHRAMCTESKRVCSGILDSLIDFAVMRNEVQVDEGTDFRLSCCEKIINTLEEFFQHKSNEHNVARSTCGLCLSVAQTDSQMRSHYRKVHLKKYWNRLTLGAEDATSDEEDETNKADTNGVAKGKPVECTFLEIGILCQCFKCKIHMNSKIQSYKVEAKSRNESFIMLSKTCVCKLCNKNYACKGNLVKHLKNHDGKKKFPCDVCGSAFTQEDYLRIHKSTKHSLNPCEKSCTKHSLNPCKMSCNECNKAFINTQSLKKHIRNVHLHMNKGLKFQCEFCDNIFSNKRNLGRHSNQFHHKKQEFQCAHCNRIYYYKQRLVDHIKIRHLQIEYVCKICGHVVRSKVSLNNHMKNHRAPEFHCEICGRMFKAKLVLDKHMVVHSEEKIFICHTCGKRFKREMNLLQHQHTHSDNRPHVCNICGKTFKLRTHVKQHMAVHGVIKNHKCLVCEKEFARKTELNSHLSTHGGLT